MIKPDIEKALNEQLNVELFSSYIYLAMAANFEHQNLSGFAKWMKIQSQEEYGHSLKFYDFILQRNGKISLTEIKAPKTNWTTPLSVFEDAFKHEQKVTKLINNIYELADKEKDYATKNFLHWFLSEQVEEEALVSKIIDQIKMIGDNKSGLYLLDHDMGQRSQEPVK